MEGEGERSRKYRGVLLFATLFYVVEHFVIKKI